MHAWPAVALAAGLATCWAILPAAPGVAASAAFERDPSTEGPPPVIVGEETPPAPRAVLSGRYVQPPQPASPRPVPGSEPSVDSRIDLRVDLVDAETGITVSEALWRIGTEEGRKAPPAPNGSVLAVDIEPGVGQHRPIEATAPEGFVAWDVGAQTVRRCRYARSLRAIHPLRPEVTVVVDVRDFDGRFVHDARIGSLKVAKRWIDGARCDVVAVGRFRVRGAPFLRREPIEFTAWIEDRTPAYLEALRAQDRVEPIDFEISEEEPEIEFVEEEPTELLGTTRSATWRGVIPDEPWQALEVAVDLPPPEPIRAFTGRGGSFGISCGG